MKWCWIVTLFAVVCTSCSSRTDEAIKRKAGDKYQSIESFFRNIEYMQGIQIIARGTAERDPQEKIDAMAKLAAKILDEDRLVDERKLNEIYPLWGTKYKANFVKGSSILARGLGKLAKEDFAISDGFLGEWDTWWRENHSKVFLSLHEQFDFEIK